MIGTKPPLKLRFIADPSKPRSLSPTGEVVMTIGRAAVFCGDTEIVDPIERNIAWIFMQFGDWDCGDPQAIHAEHEVEAIELIWTPRERPNERERFEMVGTLSSMFSRYYATKTLGEEGVIQTEAELTPGWFAPLVASDHVTIALPLWRFIIQASRDPQQKRSNS
jgi:hypothetical protein